MITNTSQKNCCLSILLVVMIRVFVDTVHVKALDDKTRIPCPINLCRKPSGLHYRDIGVNQSRPSGKVKYVIYRKY